MKVFAPNRTKRLLSGDGRAVFEVLLHGETRTGYWVCRLIVRNHSENKGEVKGNRLKNGIHRKTAPEPSASLPRLFTGSYGAGGAGSG